MNRTAIRNFATWARTTLLFQVRSRLNTYGISEKGIVEPQVVVGGITVNGLTLNDDEAKHYQQLRSQIGGNINIEVIAKITEEIAYKWFNRLVALRFMEVNGYLSYRCLSSSDPQLVDPDLLREVGAIAEGGDFDDLNLAKLSAWRESASKQPNPDEWLYRQLLLLQCGALADAIACLFDRNHDYTMLFLPPNLLNNDSILRRLVGDIAEEDWQDIEIVGWLYQFYISEKKDEVIGAKSKVKAEDIPAATQLFTPHWIVRYMVENSLGRLWLESHPESNLREKMPYYLESAPSSGGVKTVLVPQDLTVCDPACGSGHILVYAFDLLFEIYKEQGYVERDIPALILAHNLFGLDIDNRAVQLASFAVLMKARAKNSRFLRKVPKLNIVWVRHTRQFFSEKEIAKTEQVTIVSHQMSLAGMGLVDQLPLGYVAPTKKTSFVSFLTDQRSISNSLVALLSAFVDADNLGSLIVPPVFNADRIYAELNELEGKFSLFADFAVLRDVVR
ncbi:BREX-1 system adenine-specific DNA-methyltransferase PglX [Synechococcus sp. PCC 7502]|uniref:BREX-1 system adenine-specific DNA-methyltransferase PglX n=1 Tax=Synechococcus sp. PCC 7502 TaxID=1173263 RepID=UPI000302B284|nr:BREX-1 system adenine-specific DNA-methyltransferase PglX [Synechococcus sp. PCC 7502]